MTDTPPVVGDVFFLEPDPHSVDDQDASDPARKGDDETYPTDAQPEPGVVDKLQEQEE